MASTLFPRRLLAARAPLAAAAQRRALATAATAEAPKAAGVGAMRARPQCYADPAKKTIDVGAAPYSPPASFWAEVADPKSVADAAKYVNNIERYVGTVKVPVGLIGPLRVSMDDEPHADRVELIDKTYNVPMATTEGVLLASYNRGAKVRSAQRPARRARGGRAAARRARGGAAAKACLCSPPQRAK